MAVEIDHLFIFTDAGALALAPLLAAGFTEAPSNTHPGQGTACRRVFFHNAYLEFVWVHSEQEAQNELAKPLHLVKRWRYQDTGASPFGLILRPVQQPIEPVKLPFATWAYRPLFFQSQQIEVAENSDDPAEPLLFYMSFGRRPDLYPVERRLGLDHAAGVQQITGLRITLPGKRSLSPSLQAVQDAEIASFIGGEAHLAEVSFDQERQGKGQDFRPGLPLVLRW